MAFTFTTVARALALASLVLQPTLALATPRAGLDQPHQQDARASSQVLPPSEDPWYTAPAGYESTTPGTVLRNRTAQGDLPAVVGANCSAAYNLLYRTTASQGNATFAVTTVLVPKSVPAGTSALLSYQIPYDSAYIDASPSYALYESVSQDIKIALGKGYYVVVPDYEGPLASFTAGHMSGYATLDGVRAALNAAALYALPADPLYAVWGYSGGALASEWAAELQEAYAPDLDFAGAALGGLTPNVTSVLVTINEKLSAGLAPPAIIGLLSQWPAAQAYVYSQFTTVSRGAYTKANFLAAQNYTLAQAESAYELQDIFLYFQSGEATLTGSEVSAVIDQDGVMGLHGVPQMPVFAYKAVQDQISPVADTDALVAQYCAAGANILYERNSVGTHSQEELYGDPAATAWLDAVLTGRYADEYSTSGCTTLNVTTYG